MPERWGFHILSGASVAELCIATEHGVACIRDAVLMEPVRLCGEHKVQLALLVVPEILMGALRQAAAQRSIPEPVLELKDVFSARPVEALERLAGIHRPTVYFIANGNRVKIGYTTNLRSRIRTLALRESNILLLLDGGPELERALHDRFRDHRDHNTEWFDMAPDVVRFIAEHQSPALRIATADALHRRATEYYAARLTAGEVPKVREIKEDLSVGTDRAREVRTYLSTLTPLKTALRGGQGRAQEVRRILAARQVKA